MQNCYRCNNPVGLSHSVVVADASRPEVSLRLPRVRSETTADLRTRVESSYPGLLRPGWSFRGRLGTVVDEGNVLVTEAAFPRRRPVCAHDGSAVLAGRALQRISAPSTVWDGGTRVPHLLLFAITEEEDAVAGPGSTDWRGASPLHRAAEAGDVATATRILSGLRTCCARSAATAVEIGGRCFLDFALRRGKLSFGRRLLGVVADSELLDPERTARAALDLVRAGSEETLRDIAARPEHFGFTGGVRWHAEDIALSGSPNLVAVAAELELLEWGAVGVAAFFSPGRAKGDLARAVLRSAPNLAVARAGIPLSAACVHLAAESSSDCAAALRVVLQSPSAVRALRASRAPLIHALCGGRHADKVRLIRMAVGAGLYEGLAPAPPSLHQCFGRASSVWLSAAACSALAGPAVAAVCTARASNNQDTLGCVFQAPGRGTTVGFPAELVPLLAGVPREDVLGDEGSGAVVVVHPRVKIEWRADPGGTRGRMSSSVWRKVAAMLSPISCESLLRTGRWMRDVLCGCGAEELGTGSLPVTLCRFELPGGPAAAAAAIALTRRPVVAAKVGLHHAALEAAWGRPPSCPLPWPVLPTVPRDFRRESSILGLDTSIGSGRGSFTGIAMSADSPPRSPRSVRRSLRGRTGSSLQQSVLSAAGKSAAWRTRRVLCPLLSALQRSADATTAAAVCGVLRRLPRKGVRLGHFDEPWDAGAPAHCGDGVMSETLLAASFRLGFEGLPEATWAASRDSYCNAPHLHADLWQGCVVATALRFGCLRMIPVLLADSAVVGILSEGAGGKGLWKEACWAGHAAIHSVARCCGVGAGSYLGLGTCGDSVSSLLEVAARGGEETANAFLTEWQAQGEEGDIDWPEVAVVAARSGAARLVSRALPHLDAGSVRVLAEEAAALGQEEVLKALGPAAVREALTQQNWGRQGAIGDDSCDCSE
eukprot:Hpha_TRINITY_DN14347_c0_g1::TRINITY_DN14347_c0_g1_i1::g.86473::m.86473